MSQLLRRGRIAAHGLIPKPPVVAPQGLRRDVFRARMVQQRSYFEVQTSQPPRNAVTAAIANLPETPKMTAHLNRVFAPLQFPPELAARILTHVSHKHSVLSSNARLSFIGRRVLNSYLLMFLHSSSGLKPYHEYEVITERALNTYILGEFVGPKWEFGKVMKWSPATSSSTLAKDPLRAVELGKEATRSIGLYKVEGTAVEALVGGVFHQFGGATAHRLFHTRILPHILLPGRTEGLHDAFHADAQKICEQMGGLEASLLVPSQPEPSESDSRKKS